MSKLGDALFTSTQQQVLGLLYSQPDRSFYTREILRRTGMGVATIKRELDRMVAAEILTLEKVGSQHHYQANPACPIFPELVSIVAKTFGLAGVLRKAFDSISDRIDYAFVFGSIARGKENSGSDVDLLIIGDIGFMEAVSALHSAQEQLQREINPKVYSNKEWQTLLKKQDRFIKEIMAKPRMDVIGDSSEFGKLNRD